MVDPRTKVLSTSKKAAASFFGLTAFLAGFLSGIADEAGEAAWSNHNWNVALYVAAGVYFLGTFCWLIIDPVTPIEDE